MDLQAIQRIFRIKMTGQDERYSRLNFLERVLKGTQYQDKMYDFYHRDKFSSEFIPLRDRRPAVVYNLAKIIVDRSTDMLFGDMHWPSIHVEDEGSKQTAPQVETLVKYSSFMRHWRKAARMGAVGSVVVIFKIVDNKLYHEVINSKDCTPTFHPRIPEEVISVRQQLQLKGRDLIPFGYSKLEADELYWYRRDITETEEIEYYPILVSESDKYGAMKWHRNDARSFVHGFGEFPGVWIKNLESEDKLDGDSTFEGIIPFQTELDYQISQIGRVFTYTGDPMLIIKDPSMIDPNGTGEKIIRSEGNAIILNAEGDAYNLEVQAEAQKVALEYVDKVRKLAMEVGRGNRADPDKLSAVQSGKALALLHKDIIGLVSELRISYGEALLKYIQKILRATKKYSLEYPGFNDADINPDAVLSLRWGDFFEPTNEDRRSMAMFLTESINNHTISEERGTSLIAPFTEIEDEKEERDRIAKDREEEMKRAKELEQAQQLAQQNKAKEVGRSSSSPPPTG